MKIKLQKFSVSSWKLKKIAMKFSKLTVQKILFYLNLKKVNKFNFYKLKIIHIHHDPQEL